jgi:hypothetical protein
VSPKQPRLFNDHDSPPQQLELPCPSPGRPGARPGSARRVRRDWTDGAQTISDTEALGYIPGGPGKGLYCVPRKGGLGGKLIRINGLDASATVVADLGLNGVQGMVARYNSGKWELIVGHEPAGNTRRELYSVDPVTGAATFMFLLEWEDPDGLAIDANGTLYMTDDNDLYTVDWSDGTITDIGGISGYSRTEALEFAFGTASPEVSIGGVPSSWTANGALFGFDDGDEALFIIDPATGDTIEYGPCSFVTVDCEGLVFTTKWKDGYGQITVDCHD